jgi:RNA polymerase sigma-70 factor (sigma-E family)
MAEEAVPHGSTRKLVEPTREFADFVAACSPALLRSAWLLTGDGGRAEDLLQTALTKAWRHWATVMRAESPEAYVRRMVFTTYVSWWRRRWKAEVPSAFTPEGVDHADPAGIVAARDSVRRALAKLSRQQRAVVVLRYAEDRSIAETATLLGCSEGTVKVQAARALTALRMDPDLVGHAQEEVRT